MIRLALRMLAAGIAAAGAFLPINAQEARRTHIIVPPNEIVWGPAPPSVPPGAQAVTLYGDPTKDGLFAMRLKVPKGYTLPPHTHPAPEIVTVISGVIRLGLGDKLDPANTRALPAGSFYSTEPGTSHFIIFEEDSVVQVNSRGPWGMQYLDPANDPRGAKR
jgi:quercetin dioxygenase-like cupin family protein